MSAEQQNPDGSWSEAEPLGWQHVPGGDWEVYLDTTPLRANLYYEDVLMEAVTAKTRRQLDRRIRAANRKHGISTSPAPPTQDGA